MEKKALGKGLDALFPDSGPQRLAAGEIKDLPIEQIIPSRYQPRRDFAESELAELAESVRKNGVLQPVLVRRKGDGFFELVAGERRLRAATMAGLRNLPAIVRNVTDEQAMIFALVENVQRKDLNPVETARAYHRLLNEFGFSQETVAQHVGKDRSSVANLMRLLNLPNEIQMLVETGELSTGHAKVVLSLDRSEAQIKLAHKIVRDQLSVRQAEQQVIREARSHRGTRGVRHRGPFPDLEERLQKHLGTRVTITKSRKGGKIVLEYYNSGDLERLFEMLVG